MTTAWEHGVEGTRATGRPQGRLPARVHDTTHDGNGERNDAASERAVVQVRMIGPLTVVGPAGDRSGRDIGAVKTRLLLEMLLLSRGRPISKDELVHALWDGGRSLPSDPFRTLEHYVCVLRSTLSDDRTLGRALLATGANSYVIDPDLVDVDVDRFEAVLQLAMAAAPSERRVLLEEALAFGSDDLLADSPTPLLAQRERHAHGETVAGAHLWLADAALAADELHRAVWHAEAALRFAPFAEHAYRVLMVAHAGQGNRELARLTLRRCVTTLQRGLRIDPTTHTVAIGVHVQTGASLIDLLALLQTPLAA